MALSRSLVMMMMMMRRRRSDDFGLESAPTHVTVGVRTWKLDRPQGRIVGKANSWAKFVGKTRGQNSWARFVGKAEHRPQSEFVAKEFRSQSRFVFVEQDRPQDRPQDRRRNRIALRFAGKKDSSAKQLQIPYPALRTPKYPTRPQNRPQRTVQRC